MRIGANPSSNVITLLDPSLPIHGDVRTMMTRISSPIALLGLALSAFPARGAEEPEVASEYDLVYTKAGSTELKLDLARPAEGEGPFPAVVVIHGGAWRGGSKDAIAAC